MGLVSNCLTHCVTHCFTYWDLGRSFRGLLNGWVLKKRTCWVYRPSDPSFPDDCWDTYCICRHIHETWHTTPLAHWDFTPPGIQQHLGPEATRFWSQGGEQSGKADLKILETLNIFEPVWLSGRFWNWYEPIIFGVFEVTCFVSTVHQLGIPFDV